MNDMDILELALHNQQTAWKVLEHTGIIRAWERIGATVHLVGSLKSGLLAKSRDIDPVSYTHLPDGIVFPHGIIIKEFRLSMGMRSIRQLAG